MRNHTSSFVCMAVCALFVGLIFGDTAYGKSDDDIAKAMGTPYYCGEILPTPRQVEYKSSQVVLADGKSGKRFYDLRFSCGQNISELLTRLLDRRIKSYMSAFDTKGAKADAGRMIPVRFELVARDSATTDPQEPPFHPQGYRLKIEPDGITCTAGDNAGLVNGMASILQLLHVKDGKLAARCADIHDWPEFKIRYTSEYHLPAPEFFDWMMTNKINGFGASYRVFNWRKLTDTQKRQLDTIGGYVRKYGTLHFMAQLHLTGRGGPVMDTADPLQVENLFATIREIIRRAAPKHIWICFDDKIPELQPCEIEQGFKTPGAAHGALLDRIHTLVEKTAPGTIVGCVPPPYQGLAHRKWRKNYKYYDFNVQYMADVRAWPNNHTRMVWTGPVTSSKLITPAHIADYRKLIGDKPLSYWGNTWAYHQPLRNFHARYPADFAEHCVDSTIYSNINGVGPVGRYFMVTANDYYWNPQAFDSKRARRLAAIQLMGPPAEPVAERFYRFRGDDYFDRFSRKCDLALFRQILEDLQQASWDKSIPTSCWDSYNRCAERQNKPE